MTEPALYELELRRHGGRSEIHVAAGPMNVGDEIDLEGRRWRVTEVKMPRGQTKAIARYVCVDLRGQRFD